MNSSLSPHCILTEPSRETVSGKGREGNKEGKGSRVETPIHSSGSVSARAATARSGNTQPARVHTGWMAATRINGGHR